MEFKTEPYVHQREEVKSHGLTSARGLFWEMGCGKSKPILDTAAVMEEAGEIDALVIVAPRGGHRNWLKAEEGQVVTHLPQELLDRSRSHIWYSKKANTLQHQESAKKTLEHDGFAILGMTYSAGMTLAGAKYLRQFLKKRRALMVLDESPQIKSPKAKRTKFFVAIGKHATHRRILTGMPAEESPFDVYSQIRFLDPTAWHPLGIHTAASFRAFFGVWEQSYTRAGGGRTFENLVEYKNLPILSDFLKKFGSRVMKSDVLDLPEKLYARRFFDLTPEQRRVYNDLEQYFEAELDGRLITAPLTITRMLRAQQVISGYLPTSEGDNTLIPINPKKNPRIDLLMGTLEECGNQQVLVWAKYRQDITAILEEMERRGLTAVRYDGQCSDEELSENEGRFHRGEAQYFVSNPEVGGEILTLNEAHTSVYYNNSFRLKHRAQSEDRNHRIGQKNQVLYVDLVAENTIDSYIIDRLRDKQEVTAQAMGDQQKTWL